MDIGIGIVTFACSRLGSERVLWVSAGGEIERGRKGGMGWLLAGMRTLVDGAGLSLGGFFLRFFGRY